VLAIHSLLYLAGLAFDAFRKITENYIILVSQQNIDKKEVSYNQ